MSIVLLLLSYLFSIWSCNNNNDHQVVLAFVASSSKSNTRKLECTAPLQRYLSGRRWKFSDNTISNDDVLSSTALCSTKTNEEETLSNDEIRRYSRHLVLSNVGIRGQLAMKQAAVLVIGAGGLGSPVLLYLAAAGVGHVGIVDADVVDESNLQRQIIHTVSTIHTSKCQSAQQSMHQINPYVQVRIYEEELTSQSALRIVGDGFTPNLPWTIVIDGSDNFPTKYLIKYVECYLLLLLID
jgi:ThiF family